LLTWGSSMNEILAKIEAEAIAEVRRNREKAQESRNAEAEKYEQIDERFRNCIKVLLRNGLDGIVNYPNFRFEQWEEKIEVRCQYYFGLKLIEWSFCLKYLRSQRSIIATSGGSNQYDSNEIIWTYIHDQKDDNDEELGRCFRDWIKKMMICVASCDDRSR
jgi:hypothetical protein